jgi:regulator of extracellular matrix RemA (YlzA/DUF370 family)
VISQEEFLNNLKNKNLLRVGFGNTVSAERIIAIIDPDSAPMKRLIKYARHEYDLTDLTSDHPVRAIIDDNKVFLSAIKAETLSDRFNKLKSKELMSWPIKETR